MDMVARGLAAAAGKANTRQALRDKLLAAAQRGISPPAPGEMAVLPPLSTASWASSTAYAQGTYVFNGAYVYWAIKAGTSAASGGPSGTSGNIADGTVIWHCVGHRAPVAYANSLTLYADQRLYNGGWEFRVTVGGTTNASGSGPTPSTLTDGTVSFVLIGRQRLPLVQLNSAIGAGLTQQVAWNDTAGASVLGGVRMQDGPNPRAYIVSRDGASSTTKPALDSTSGGGGIVATVTDARVAEFRGTDGSAIWLFVDNDLVAHVATVNGSSYSVRLDFTGLVQPRAAKTIRAMTWLRTKYAGWYATAADRFKAYTPRVPLRAVLIGDSFADGATSTHFSPTFSQQLGLRLGIDDWWQVGVGQTGILQPGTTSNYVDRFTRDVIGNRPDLVIIEGSNNDMPGVPGSYSLTDLQNALAGLIARVRSEIPNAAVIVMGMWNNRGAFTGNGATWESMIASLCASLNVPYVNWSDYLTDGGYVGTVAGSGGNSIDYTGPDGTHPTSIGHYMRAQRLEQQIVGSAYPALT